MPERAVDVVEAARRRIPPWPSTSPLMLVSEGFDLLKDAAIAFDAGAYYSASVGLRAVGESAGYHFLTRRRVKESGYQIYHPLDLAGKVRRVDFREVKEGLVARRVLTSPLLLAWDRIQERGNSMAHLAARKVSKVQKWLTAGPTGPLCLVPSHEEGLEDLRNACEILVALAAEQIAEP